MNNKFINTIKFLLENNKLIKNDNSDLYLKSKIILELLQLWYYFVFFDIVHKTKNECKLIGYNLMKKILNMTIDELKICRDKYLNYYQGTNFPSDKSIQFVNDILYHSKNSLYDSKNSLFDSKNSLYDDNLSISKKIYFNDIFE